MPSEPGVISGLLALLSPVVIAGFHVVGQWCGCDVATLLHGHMWKVGGCRVVMS
jgi:hypothetical protein